MASPVKLYQREMHDNLGFFANWFPTDPVAVGDAGLLEGGRFRRMSSLKELGIVCRRSISSDGQDVYYTSTRGTKLDAGGGVAGQAPVTAKVTLEFSRSGAFVFHATGLRVERLENRSAVADALVEAYQQKRWDKKWLLIEAIHVADRATIVVSEDKSAGLELMADASGVAPIASLADPRVNLQVTSMRGKLVHVIGASGLKPLYSCLRVRAPIVGVPSTRPVRGTARSGVEEVLSRPSINELLDS